MVHAIAHKYVSLCNLISMRNMLCSIQTFVHFLFNNMIIHSWRFCILIQQIYFASFAFIQISARFGDDNGKHISSLVFYIYTTFEIIEIWMLAHFCLHWGHYIVFVENLIRFCQNNHCVGLVLNISA